MFYIQKFSEEIPGADTSSCVHLANNETISGEKTFVKKFTLRAFIAQILPLFSDVVMILFINAIENRIGLNRNINFNSEVTAYI